MSLKATPAAFNRSGDSHIAQLGSIEHFDLTATRAELQRTAKALHLEALSLSGGSQFAAMALSAHFGRRSGVCA